jgi:hypothetical protein
LRRFHTIVTEVAESGRQTVSIDARKILKRLIFRQLDSSRQASIISLFLATIPSYFILIRGEFKGLLLHQ